MTRNRLVGGEYAVPSRKTVAEIEARLVREKIDESRRLQLENDLLKIEEARLCSKARAKNRDAVVRLVLVFVLGFVVSFVFSWAHVL